MLDPFPGPFCKTKAGTLDMLKRHLILRDGNKCESCSFAACTESDLNNHACSNRMVSSSSAVAATEDDDAAMITPDVAAAAKLTCPFCPTEFSEKEEWVDHAAKAHPEKAPTVCYICVRVFSTALGMSLHFGEAHQGETLRKEFSADGNDEGPAVASLSGNQDTVNPVKGASRTVVIRPPKHDSESEPGSPGKA